ncbi:MAG: hypothetical protein IJP31_09750 [Lachnospiraceae bacterium]|nr:hypothetical protein [Lachnospiraceae bacterium]
MLGKLIKHEWKRLWKVPTVLLALLLALAVGTGLTFSRPVLESEAVGLDIVMVISGLIWITFFIALVGISFAITIYLALQFYKSMYSDEGYLTHTLPVTSVQLLTSKGLVVSIWTVLCSLGIILSILIAGSMAVHSFPEMDWQTMWMEIQTEWQELLIALEMEGVNMSQLIVPGIIGIVISVFYGTALIIGSLTIGQLARKHRIAFSFLAGIVISWLVSALQSIIQIPISFQLTFNQSLGIFPYMVGSLWIQDILYAIVTVVLFIVSNNIIKNRLNLE